MPRAVGALAVFVVALVALSLESARVSHWADENDYLITSRYARLAFVERDFANPEWQDGYWTHTQPMLTRFVVGAWLLMRGRDLDAMPERYDLTKSQAENLRKGRVPDAALLADARAPMVGLAAGAVALVFLLGWSLRGPLAGLLAAGLTLGSPLFREHAVRAMPEAPLAFFAVLAALVGVAAVRRGRRGAITWRWALGLGVALGLACAAKLTGVLGLVAVVVYVGMVAAGRLRGVRGQDLATARAPSWRGLVGGWLLALAVAAVVFVAADPHLYPNPPLHVAHLFQHRLDDERGRQREVPRLAVRDPLDRAARVFGNSLVAGTATGSLGLPLEPALFAVGLLALLRSAGKRGAGAPECVVLACVGAYFGGISAALHLDYGRYYVPTLVLGATASAVGVWTLVALVARVLPSRRITAPSAPSPSEATPTAPAGGQTTRRWSSP